MTDCSAIALLRCEGLLCDDVLGKQAGLGKTSCLKVIDVCLICEIAHACFLTELQEKRSH